MKSDERKIYYGVKDNVLTHISEVPRGLACGCTCFECGAPFEARKGPIMKHHFAHAKKSSTCNHSGMTVLHRVFQETSLELKYIMVPKYHSMYEDDIDIQWIKINVDKVELEYNVGYARFDILITSGDYKLAVEIRNTHKVDSIKTFRIYQNKQDTLEIDISKLPEDITKDDILNILQNPSDLKMWIYYKDEQSIIAKQMLEVKKLYNISTSPRLKNQTVIEDCPIAVMVDRCLPNGKPCANIDEHCSICGFLIGYQPWFVKLRFFENIVIKDIIQYNEDGYFKEGKYSENYIRSLFATQCLPQYQLNYKFLCAGNLYIGEESDLKLTFEQRKQKYESIDNIGYKNILNNKCPLCGYPLELRENISSDGKIQ